MVHPSIFNRLQGYPTNAREWVARMQSANLNHGEQLALDAWLKADVANVEAFARAQKVAQWGLKLRDHPDLMAELPGYEAHRASAPQNVASKLQNNRWKWLTAGGGLKMASGGLALAASICIAVFSYQQRPAIDDATQTYKTARGEQRQVLLADGSRLFVNVDSAVTVRLTATARLLELQRGEAFFEVSRDPNRPMRVTVGTSEVRVVGTKFSVRRDDASMEVVVTEGRVQVLPDVAQAASATAAPPTDLVPGNRYRKQHTATQAQVVNVDTRAATAWLSGNIEFDAAPLSQVIADINRYSNRPFVIDDSAIAQISQIAVSGSFRVGDIESVKFALKDRLNIDSSDDGKQVLLRR